jgi:hypothetical protein
MVFFVGSFFEFVNVFQKVTKLDKFTIGKKNSHFFWVIKNPQFFPKRKQLTQLG